MNPDFAQSANIINFTKQQILYSIYKVRCLFDTAMPKNQIEFTI